ncbi:hypothetical protein [Chitinophaga pinensis]|uniref:hypothetical protein n=1 Tax=Chitinophaga pinensis TaxID=79329 RepID=UPI001C9951D1|nr:hypothetical protein [Chitinophaga pinensis]
MYFSLSESEFAALKNQLTGNSIEEKLRSAGPVSLALAAGDIYPETAGWIW